ncbi:MAG: DUF371 domain-containing protein [Archaeoglobales archaeon]|nr:DUF371 domain-containing protein [Archaeoglobales archaeon]
MLYTIFARGHKNLRATHRTTLEVTKESYLTPRGNCIVGVKASSSARDLPEWLKKEIKSDKMFFVVIKLPDYGMEDSFYTHGSREMSLDHAKDIVFRKSNFICSRTVGIRSTKAAIDLNREMIELMKDEKTEIVVEIKVP